MIALSEKDVDRYLIKLLNDPIEQFPDELGGEELWVRIARRTERHGLAPLMYWKFRQVPSLIPQSIFEQFKQSYLTTLGRNRIFFAELQRVLGWLTAQGITVVLLKGAVFARTFYEDIGLRPMSDLDILLRKEDIPGAVHLLKQHGYEEPVLHQSELLKQDASHDVHLRRAQPPHVDIEVHWLLVGGEKFRHKTDMSWFWQRVVLLTGWGEGVATLSPTAHLLYLCAHLGYQHGLASVGWLWLVELARFLERYHQEIDWTDFVEGANHLTWSAAAYYTFQAVDQLFPQTSLPDQVMSQLRAQMTAEEESHVIAMSQVVPSRVAFAWKQFEQLDNAARLRAVISRLFPSLAFMRQRYGFRSNWQAILGYPVRWLDMTNVLLKYVIARFRANKKRQNRARRDFPFLA